MNKTFLFLSLAVCMTLTAFAQNRASQVSTDPAPRIVKMPVLSTPRLELDTLLPTSFDDPCGQNLIIYLSNWGYLAGNNDFGDLRKAQRFNFGGSGTFNVQEIWGFFIAADAVGDANLHAEVWSADANGAPDMVLGTSNPVKTSEVVLNDTFVLPTIFSFNVPVVMNSSQFFASIDFSALYTANDTAGLVTTEDPCGSGKQCLGAMGRQ